MKKIQRNFRLPAELLEKLEQAAGEYRSLTMTDLVEIALERLLDMSKEERDKIVMDHLLNRK